MAKNPETVLKEHAKKLDNITKDFAKNRKAYLKEVAEEFIEVIQARTRKGKDGEGENFPEHSKSYLKIRKRYKKNLSRHTNVKKSNLTATGQLVDAIIGGVNNSG